MSFEEGQYLIIAKDGTQLGRSVIEDRSLLPKDILLLRPDVTELQPLILLKDGDEYTMKAGGAEVGISGRFGSDSMVAFLIPESGPGASKLTFEEVSDGYKISVDGRYFTKGDEAMMGHRVRLGSESEVVIFDVNSAD